MLIADRDIYLGYPPVVPVAWMPLCSRWLGQDLTVDVATRFSDDGAASLRVYLASVRHKSKAVQIEPLSIQRVLLSGGAYIDKRAKEMIAKVDYQLAAYCASDLWC